MNKKIGMQVFAVYEQYLREPEATLRSIASLGYEGVEFAGYANMDVSHLRDLMDSLGMQSFSTHVTFDRLQSSLAQEMDDALTLGCRYMVCPRIDAAQLSTEEGVRDAADFLGQTAEILEQSGIELCLHNHHTELVTLHGEMVLDRLLAGNGNKRVGLEWDAFWALFSDVQPDAYIRSHPDDCPLYNLKDYVRLPKRALSPNASVVERVVDALSGDCTLRHVPIGQGIGRCDEAIAYALSNPRIEWLIIEPVLYDMEPIACLRES
ncbi:sugar phosphate isomerase/epimerase, partial [Eubacteriales bacterium OttesenSCG-928-N13]|nr:sugar phosphate isomerase/epimerase [Eubacteriales bacterium OttesenSCG-928-N13]